MINYLGQTETAKLRSAIKKGKLMINTKLLNQRMKEMGISQTKAAEALGIKQPTFSQKCSGVRSFKVQELQKLVNLLKIPDEDVAKYFFA